MKDQLRTSCCWAFALTTAAEYSYAKELYEQTGEVYAGELSPGHITQFFYNREPDPLGNTEGDLNELALRTASCSSVAMMFLPCSIWQPGLVS